MIQDQSEFERTEGFGPVGPPISGATAIVGIVQFQGRLIVAGANGVFELIDGKWRPMAFAETPQRSA